MPTLSYAIRGIRFYLKDDQHNDLLRFLTPLFFLDPDPCFASKSAQKEYYEQRRFSRVHLVRCNC